MDEDGKRDFTDAIGAMIGVVIVIVVVAVGLVKFCQWAF